MTSPIQDSRAQGAKTCHLANLPIEVLHDILDDPALDDDVSYLSLALTSRWLYPHAIRRWDAAKAWARVRSSFFNIAGGDAVAVAVDELSSSELPRVGRIRYACPTAFFPRGPLPFVWDGTEESLHSLPAVEGPPVHLRMRPQHTLLGDLVTHAYNRSRAPSRERERDRLGPKSAAQLVGWLARQGADPNQVACNRCLLSTYRIGPVEDEVRTGDWLKVVGNSAHAPMTQLSYIFEYGWQGQEACLAVAASLVRHGARFPPTVPYPKCSNASCSRRFHPFDTTAECPCSPQGGGQKGVADGEPVSTLRMAISASCPPLYLWLALRHIPKAEQEKSLFSGGGSRPSWCDLFLASLEWEQLDRFRDQAYPKRRENGQVPLKHRQNQVVVGAAKKLALLERSGIVGPREVDFVYGRLRAWLTAGARARPPLKKFYKVFGNNGWSAWERDYAEDVDLFWRNKYGIADEEGLAVPLVSEGCEMGTVRACYVRLAKGLSIDS